MVLYVWFCVCLSLVVCVPLVLALWVYQAACVTGVVAAWLDLGVDQVTGLAVVVSVSLCAKLAIPIFGRR